VDHSTSPKTKGNADVKNEVSSSNDRANSHIRKGTTCGMRMTAEMEFVDDWLNMHSETINVQQKR